MSVDLQQKIKLHEGDKYVELPLINLLRITVVHLKSFVQEYARIYPEVERFWKWMLKEKLKVGEGDAVLQ